MVLWGALQIGIAAIAIAFVWVAEEYGPPHNQRDMTPGQMLAWGGICAFGATWILAKAADMRPLFRTALRIMVAAAVAGMAATAFHHLAA